MKLTVYLTKALVGYVSVDLGGAYIAVAQHHLNRAKIGAVLEEVSGEAMS